MSEERMADEVSRKIELAWLTAFYGGLLTDKQRQVLTLHCEEDLSLAEIAQEAGVSRQGVHDMLTRAAQRLFDMEEKLGMAARFKRMENGLEQCRALLKEKRYDEAEGVIDTLIRLDQEENNGL
ncbi:MAG: DNA-binding protein [Clostridia bacterium]|nr:DNA-binding protein [Clostridia bacterium]